MPADPTIDEMRAFLDAQYPPDPHEDPIAAIFDREEAIYWFSANWHGGQSTNLYSACSTSDYRPGSSTSGPETGSMSDLMLRSLEVEYAGIIDTGMGRVHHVDGWVSIEADTDEIYEWTHRPGAAWPCSTLADADHVTVEFDARGDLIDAQHPGTDDIDGHELSAWATDVLELAGLADHPARRDSA